MKITKIKDSFNEYRMELSWGELQAVYASMQKDHSGPIADEVYNGLEFYMSGRLPFPGEDQSEVDKADEVEKEAERRLPSPEGDAGAEPEGGELDEPEGAEPEGGDEVGEPGPGPDDRLPAPPED